MKSNDRNNEKLSKTIELDKIKKKMEQMKLDASAQINEQLDKLIDEISNELEQNQFSTKTQNLFNNNYRDEIQDKIITKEGRLPDKQFMIRNSLLTDLFQNTHIQTIYHIFLAILFGLFINCTVYDFIHKGRVNLGLDLILKQFANLHTVIYIWIGMFICSLSVYIGLYYWRIVRSQLFPNSISLKLWDKFCSALYICYSLTFLYFFTSSTVSYELTISESMAILSEMIRFLMKSHAYVRSNVPKILRHKRHSEDEEVVPEFSKFLYFWFAPALVYQDTYPRTKTVRWNYVLFCFVEVLACIFHINFVFQHFLVTDFRDFGLRYYSWQEITLSMLGNGMAGMLFLLCVFYAMLHSWMNGFAEMLRFGDRMFYKDWWTSTNYGRYYRTWNVVVHDWLYTYIYKDFYEIVVPNNKFVAKFMVFFISAFFHEFIIGFSFRFCYPILFTMFFGVGTVISSLECNNISLANSAIWYGLALGMGINISAYSIEFYARLNCPVENNNIVSYFIPRSFTCNVDRN